jgi:hypothetical protein
MTPLEVATETSAATELQTATQECWGRGAVAAAPTCATHGHHSRHALTSSNAPFIRAIFRRVTDRPSQTLATLVPQLHRPPPSSRFWPVDHWRLRLPCLLIPTHTIATATACCRGEIRHLKHGSSLGGGKELLFGQMTLLPPVQGLGCARHTRTVPPAPSS